MGGGGDGGGDKGLGGRWGVLSRVAVCVAGWGQWQYVSVAGAVSVGEVVGRECKA